jgi:hypothetical protein
MEKEKLMIFAIRDDYCGYSVEDDFEKVAKFNNELGYGFMLQVSGELVLLANELKSIKDVIRTLTEWKKEEWFKLNKTSNKVWWPTFSNQKIEYVTLPQANKLYKETKNKYDFVLTMIQETYRIHGDESKISLNEFLTEIEIE